LKSCLRKSPLETENVKIYHLLSQSQKGKAPSLGWKSNREKRAKEVKIKTDNGEEEKAIYSIIFGRSVAVNNNAHENNRKCTSE
jgi:hypothetical protein